MRTAVVTTLLAAAAALACAAPAAAEEPVWLGLFEGHGIAPASDARRARAAVRGARRLGVQCWELGPVRGGGNQSYTATCADGEKALAALGKDAAAAILDELDRPALTVRTFDALTHALGRTGRDDVAPLLITALERIDARSGLADERVRAAGRESLEHLELELEVLTYANPNEEVPWNVSSVTGSDDARIRRHTHAWWAWLTAHSPGSRAAWKAGALAKARAALTGGDHGEAFLGARRLASFAETRGEGIAALKAMPKRAGWPEKETWAVTSALEELAPKRR